VPEPATWLLACVGLAAIIGCKWREKQAAF